MNAQETAAPANVPPPAPSSNPTPFAPPPRAPRPPAEPFTQADIAAVWTQPWRLVEFVLSGSSRIAANVAQGKHLGSLVLALMLTSILFALPYASVVAQRPWWDSWWRVVVFYLGSTLICVPALQVFSSFLNLRVSLPQILVFALTIPAVGALFTFGFAPILGFLRITGDGDGDLVSWHTISIVLLVFASLAGIAQLWRCLAASKGLPSRWRFVAVVFAWHWIFIVVLLRMGDELGL